MCQPIVGFPDRGPFRDVECFQCDVRWQTDGTDPHANDAFPITWVTPTAALEARRIRMENNSTWVALPICEPLPTRDSAIPVLP